jgi:hypothetical protein
MTEAVALNRTAVIPDMFCLHPVHNSGGYGSSKMDRLVNVEALRKIPGLALVYESELPKKLTEGYWSVHPRTDWSTTPQMDPAVLDSRKDALIVRVWKHGYWFEQKSQWSRERSKVVRQRILKAIYGLTSAVTEVAQQMMDRLGSGYCALHVRRGDKARISPQLAHDTTGGTILANATIASFLDKCSAVYIATDERNMAVFQPLFARYKAMTLENFSLPESFTVYDKVIIDYYLCGNPSKASVGNEQIALHIPTFCTDYEHKGYSLAAGSGTLCLTHVKKQM